jgi:hypothetical protein
MISQIEQTDATAGAIPLSTIQPPVVELNGEGDLPGEAVQPAASRSLEPLPQAERDDHPGDAVAATTPIGEPEPSFGLPVHPVCDLFPLMTEFELEKLAGDIKSNGLAHPVVMHEGKIIDGRNRLLACKKVGVKATFINWREMYSGPMSLSQWIWSVNAERRHLTVDQIAMVHAALHSWQEKESARLRQIKAGSQQGEHGKEGGRCKIKPLPSISSEGVSTSIDYPTPDTGKDRSGETSVKLAREAGVSEYKMRQALNVMDDPALVKEVTAGKTKLRTAAKRAKAKKIGASIDPLKPRKAASPVAATPGSKSSFAISDTVNSIMSRVDEALDKATDDERKLFLKELIATLKTRK